MIKLIYLLQKSCKNGSRLKVVSCRQWLISVYMFTTSRFVSSSNTAQCLSPLPSAQVSPSSALFSFQCWQHRCILSSTRPSVERTCCPQTALRRAWISWPLRITALANERPADTSTLPTGTSRIGVTMTWSSKRSECAHTDAAAFRRGSQRRALPTTTARLARNESATTTQAILSEVWSGGNRVFGFPEV